MHRIPSLDGLRALAIVLVCLCHLAYLKDHATQHFASLGPLGVRIFFVISGMLITGLLLREQERTGGISLRNFYIRRTLRIFPAMWFYVAVMAALSAAGIIVLHHNDILYALTYTINYFPGRSWYLSHIWSLSIEEQFYLLWPLILCWGGRRIALRAAVLAIIGAPVLRVFLFFVFPTWHTMAWFPTSCDSIATGCLLALLPAGKWRERIDRIVTARWFVILPVLVFLVNSLLQRADSHGHLHLLLAAIGVPLMNFGIVLSVQRVVAYPRDFIGQILNAPPVTWIGRISYSLYLWQMPFLNHDASSWVTKTPVNLAASLAAACFSYYLIENPILRLRKRMGWGEKAPARGAPSGDVAIATEAVSS